MVGSMNAGAAHLAPRELGRFQPGDHLRVRRPAGYFHHGVYVNDERVIQFGGRICDKPRATIGAVTLNGFESGGIAERVRHGHTGFLWLRLPDALPAEDVVRRAEWLLQDHPPKRYNLVGDNCEHAANWCATLGYFESHQSRAAFLFAGVAVGAGTLWYGASPSWRRFAIAAAAAVSSCAVVL